MSNLLPGMAGFVVDVVRVSGSVQIRIERDADQHRLPIPAFFIADADDRAQMQVVDVNLIRQSLGSPHP